MATFYADSAGTQGTGDGSSAANACTLKQALENDGILHTALVAGSVIYCKNGTTITFDGSSGVFATPAVSGTSTAPILVEGYATTVGDGGVVTIDDSDSGATNSCISAATLGYWKWANIKLTNVRTGWAHNTSCNGTRWVNCGVVGGASVASGWLVQCTFIGNNWVNCYGYGKSTCITESGRGGAFHNCVAIDCSNGFSSAATTAGAVFSFCMAHSCTNDGFVAAGTGTTFINCTSNRNGSDGYYISAGTDNAVFINSAATSNGAYGIEGAANCHVTLINCAMAATNETNASGKVSSNVTIAYETGEVTSDPVYTAGNPGTTTDVDLSISSSSGWKAAGVGLPADFFTGTATYVDLGAAQRQESAAANCAHVIGG